MKKRSQGLQIRTRLRGKLCADAGKVEEAFLNAAAHFRIHCSAYYTPKCPFQLPSPPHFLSFLRPPAPCSGWQPPTPTSGMEKASRFDDTQRRKSQPPQRLHYDAIVIGSGYGGSVAAFRLSQADPSLSVCVLEKGHSWQPQQFPTTFWQLIRTLTIHTPLGTIGSKEALLQVYLQADCLSMLGVGVGGGSLVNGGIILPTPLRTRRDPRWPKEWEQNWHAAERRARAMLQPETIPHAFPTTLVMDTMLANDPTSIEDEGGLKKDDMLQLSVTFSNKKNVAGVEQAGCKACGNCFHGCPYNAKSSTDKNYLAAAVQAGAEIRTECAVSFIARAPAEEDSYVCDSVGEGCSRHDYSEPEIRWRIYLNEVDYLTADFVILAAGVHGTMEILFRSKERGLHVSDLLGCGVSGNGNNLAFIGAPKAPTKGTSISNKDFTGIAMSSRPGPSISNSYTSSLGFTIQTAIAPRNFPHMVYKCLSSLPEGYGLLDRIWNDMKQLVPSHHGRSILVNVMGHDAADGVLQFDQRSERLKFTPPRDELIVKKVKSMQKLATRLQGLLYFSRFRSTSVHYLGGCTVGKDKSTGVTNASGQMFSTKDGDVIHDGLYVCDASLIPCSVGVNPCFTIATAAEHVSRCIVRDALQHNLHKQERQWHLGNGQAAYANLNGVVSPKEEKLSLPVEISSKYGRSSVVIVRETLQGNLGGMPCSLKLVLHMDVGVDEKDSNFSLLQGKATSRTPFTQYMHYHLLLSGPSGKSVSCCNFISNLTHGMSNLVQVNKSKGTGGHVDTSSSSLPPLQGRLHISLFELVRSILTLRGPHKLLFVKSLLQSIFQTYSLENPNLSSSTSKAAQCCQDSKVAISQKHPYPAHRHYDLQTGDGTPISMIQWPCNQSKSCGDALNNERAEVVLLLNGYCTESFWLPTEESDLPFQRYMRWWGKVHLSMSWLIALED
ncbi:hypothetical protein GOP47_0023019 [Adiantum capillus-veneris]|uniref:Cholesterol oxidase n=1 Tax=Adiantum capillus-veneris TaxID=13818 RepID=A0A9D4U6Y1_ADICA|nr:hypothetical protein GOP47_0023019 [Adiantum capillus-veneris]